jgi:hypothetical protein
MVESQVRQVVNDILTRVGEPPIPTPATNVWLREWIQEKESSKSEGTAEKYRGVIEGFITHLGGRAEKPLTVVAYEAELRTLLGAGANDSSAAFCCRQSPFLSGRLDG